MNYKYFNIEVELNETEAQTLNMLMDYAIGKGARAEKLDPNKIKSLLDYGIVAIENDRVFINPVHFYLLAITKMDLTDAFIELNEKLIMDQKEKRESSSTLDFEAFLNSGCINRFSDYYSEGFLSMVRNLSIMLMPKMEQFESSEANKESLNIAFTESFIEEVYRLGESFNL
jgi:hypothetical protein